MSKSGNIYQKLEKSAERLAQAKAKPELLNNVVRRRLKDGSIIKIEIPRQRLEKILLECQVVDGGCWIFRKTKGYKNLVFNRNTMGLHVVFIQVFKPDSFSPNMEVMHSCDYKSCINPDHLSYGTHTQNVIDAYKTGAIPRQNGEIHPQATLTDDAVLSLRLINRLSPERGWKTKAAKFLGTSFTAIWSAINNRTYKHLP